ncbi:hypothetical protein M758_UG273600 [Ceratodon purpureus]|nr:hypothetical protein M758_UG273600 [Ceratodon purpureus]
METTLRCPSDQGSRGPRSRFSPPRRQQRHCTDRPRSGSDVVIDPSSEAHEEAKASEGACGEDGWEAAN